LPELEKSGKEVDFETRMNMTPLLMGQCAGAVKEIQPAAVIIDSMVKECIQILRANTAKISKL